MGWGRQEQIEKVKEVSRIGYYRNELSAREKSQNYPEETREFAIRDTNQTSSQKFDLWYYTRIRVAVSLFVIFCYRISGGR